VLGIGIEVRRASRLGQIPLLIAADIEEGVGQRFSGATWFPPMAISGIARKTKVRLNTMPNRWGITAQEALAIGINWYRGSRYNNNPDNPVINVRAFGKLIDLFSECLYSRC